MKKHKHNTGSTIILTILLVSILFVTVIGATFAYFIAEVKYVESPKDTVIESNTLVIEYATSNSINYTSVFPGRPEWRDGETPTNKLTFTLSSPVTATFKTAYDIYLNITENDFETDNLVFYLKPNECRREDNSGSKLGALVAEKQFQYDYDGQTVTIGAIPAGFKGKYKISGGSILGGLGCIDKWDFEIWLYEVNRVQNEDQARTLTATIEIEPGAVYPIDYKN